MNKEKRRDFLKKGFLFLVGGIATLFGISGQKFKKWSNKDSLTSKKAMHWKNLAG